MGRHEAATEWWETYRKSPIAVGASVGVFCLLIYLILVGTDDHPEPLKSVICSFSVVDGVVQEKITCHPVDGGRVEPQKPPPSTTHTSLRPTPTRTPAPTTTPAHQSLLPSPTLLTTIPTNVLTPDNQ